MFAIVDRCDQTHRNFRQTQTIDHQWLHLTSCLGACGSETTKRTCAREEKEGLWLEQTNAQMLAKIKLKLFEGSWTRFVQYKSSYYRLNAIDVDLMNSH